MIAVSSYHLIVVVILTTFAAFMLAPINMTFHAILEIRDALFTMFTSDICLGVFMAAIAGVCCETVGMAGLAAAIAVTMPYWEGVRAVIGGWLPGGS
jgi:hypothetical protein